MSDKIENPPAFQYRREEYQADKKMWVINTPGMTLRDYFAAAALKGRGYGGDIPCQAMDTAAKSAFHMADAMLKARSEG